MIPVDDARQHLLDFAESFSWDRLDRRQKVDTFMAIAKARQFQSYQELELAFCEFISPS
ncbi:MAG TPA: hypothetical protein VF938_09945 [Candidatus Angelobacter sp.]